MIEPVQAFEIEWTGFCAEGVGCGDAVSLIVDCVDGYIVDGFRNKAGKGY